MNQRFVIEGQLPDLNSIISESKRHWSKYATTKKEWTEIVCYIAEDCLHEISKKVFFQFDWYCKNRKKDPDNISSGGRKIILDGLVMARVLQNDGWKYVGGFSERFFVDEKRPRVEVLIDEYHLGEENAILLKS